MPLKRCIHHGPAVSGDQDTFGGLRRSTGTPGARTRCSSTPTRTRAIPVTLAGVQERRRPRRQAADARHREHRGHRRGSGACAGRVSYRWRRHPGATRPRQLKDLSRWCCSPRPVAFGPRRGSAVRDQRPHHRPVSSPETSREMQQIALQGGYAGLSRRLSYSGGRGR